MQSMRNPRIFFIFNQQDMGGSLNLYEDITRYIEVRDKIVMKASDNERFFAAINPKAVEFNSFFKAKPLGLNRIRSLVQDACKANGITGVGPNDRIVFHGLRGTTTSALVGAAKSGTAICLRTGHKAEENLKHYNHLRGAEGADQQAIIFRGKATDEGIKLNSDKEPD